MGVKALVKELASDFSAAGKFLLGGAIAVSFFEKELPAAPEVISTALLVGFGLWFIGKLIVISIPDEEKTESGESGD